MSFRELRDFTEYMRVLGYPRLVSVDNFRTPNFGLVADILYWMIHRYDPSVSISDDISTEDCRVEFLTSVAHAMWSKSGMKLNTKRLYSADGKAVKELLKIANLLYTAHKSNILEENTDPAGKTEEDTDPSYKLHTKLPDVKATRKLASSITESGAKLFDLLNSERELSADRQKCLRFLDSISNNLDSTSEHKFVEQKLEDLLNHAKDNVRALGKQCEDLASDEKTLEVKIKKKQGELERNDKRLKSLQSVRPAFMDEYEKLEGELEKQYEVYLEKFRNLDYLEHRLEQYNRKEREKLEESERARKRIQMSVMEKKARDLRGDEDENLFEDDEEDHSEDDQDRAGGKDRRNRDSPQQDSLSGGRKQRSVALSDESEISVESEESNGESDRSSLGSGSLSDEDLIDDNDDGSDTDVSDISEEEDGVDDGSEDDISDNSDDEF